MNMLLVFKGNKNKIKYLHRYSIKSSVTIVVIFLALSLVILFRGRRHDTPIHQLPRAISAFQQSS